MPCPICGSRLFEGEKINSISFGTGQEKLMHINGCNHCYPSRPDVKRLCPVCKEQIPADGFVVGRMWQRGEKMHLHIVGCTVCKPRYKTSKK